MEFVYILIITGSNLFRILWRNRRGIVDLDATPLLLLAIMERQLPATLLLGRAKPQPHQVPPGRWRRKVLVCSPRV